jgi:hypothetical protein
MADLRVSFPQPCDERWEGMAKAGCTRICSRCDTAVHDLSQYDLDEAEALLRSSADICVRAQIDADGTVALRAGQQGSGRRMVVAAAVSAALLTAGQPAFARQERPGGAIAGHVWAAGYRVRIEATSQSGMTFRTRVKANGRYHLRHLPAGTYSLRFVPACGDDWTIENVVVGAGLSNVPEGTRQGGCIVVGLLRIEGDSIG